MKEYNSKGAIVRNPEDDKKLEEIRRIKRIKIEEMNDAVDRGYLGRRKEILNEINALDKEAKCFEELINSKITNEGKLVGLKPLDDETKDLVFKRMDEVKAGEKIKDSPAQVEEKYRKEYAGTTFHDYSVAHVMPGTLPKKLLNWNWIVSILLIIFFFSLLFFVIGNSNLQTTHLIPSNFSNNITGKVANPDLLVTNTSTTTGTLNQSKFKHTYIDNEGNTHEVTDYTSQGGNKYDVIIKTASISKSESIIIVNNVSENKSEPSKNEDSDLIANIEKQILGWWDETKPKVEFNSATYEIENIVFNKVNEERRTQGLNALVWDSNLAEIARLHSLDMANRSYFSHENPEGEDPTMRAIRYGYNVHKELGNGWYSDGIGENIGMMPTGNVQGYGYVSSSNDIADAMMQSWMNSPGHRANILKVIIISLELAWHTMDTALIT